MDSRKIGQGARSGGCQEQMQKSESTRGILGKGKDQGKEKQNKELKLESGFIESQIPGEVVGDWEDIE